MKKIRLNKLIFFIIGLFFIPVVSAQAASFSISSSSYNVTVGSSVTVYVRGVDLAGKFTVSSSNSSVFSGGGNVWVDKDTQSVKFTAKSAGSVTVKVTPTNVSDYNGNQITGSKSIILKSYVPRSLETNNYLSSLSVDGTDLVPSFSKDTENYIIDLEPGTTKVKVNAEKENKYASVSGTGEIEVKEGSNDIKVVVAAENGNKRTYTITANVREYNPINVKVGNSDFTVVRKKQELTKPDNYEEATIEIDGEGIPAFKSNITGYTLVGLKDVTGAVRLFIYDKGYKPYTYLSFNKLDLIILEADVKIPVGFVKDTITINKEEVTCYKNNELNITLLYGKSAVTGQNNFYSFENSDMTIQKFNLDSYTKVVDKINLYNYIIIGMGGFILLILFILLIVIIKKNKKLSSKKEFLEKTMKIDTNQIKEEAKLSKKEQKKLNKLKVKKEKEDSILLRKKQEALKEQQRTEEKNKKKLEKQNKKSDQKDDDMFQL